MAASSALSALQGRLLASFTNRLTLLRPTTAPHITASTSTSTTRPFSSSTPRPAGPPPGAAFHGGQPIRRSKRHQVDRDPKIKILDKALYKLKFVPPPLRMGRNRYLRHWTIHRAWLLFRRQQREARERELMQQYQSMANACEALRTMRGPGLRDEGYLYRVAMEKKGVYRHGGVPIEYARMQTETPAREAWNHDWKR
ncbi:uncharacterized protein SPSK_06642 [Sporothrix schenckii 1099-18]|uniref:Uncharacterized protein n=1 Tax=Sporothrix schenckii 1099-18 TaxID=1397361 RepID=A0A0F2MJY2_SPOSC|nr:uncharacterized protein SPSK_06642 [Sporothrix schenckii 1099-18]KJR90003.1 hypothetical protein SPSK_06642 [Sporothrix schenckii 1099-18]